MADSETAIANQALLKIGSTGDLIGSFEDSSLTARVCKIEYPQTRDELFAEFSWPRATRHAYPAQLGGATWVSTAAYAQGAFVSYAPSFANVVNMPETVSTFVYVALAAVAAKPTGNTTPDTSPTVWAQVSRAGWGFVFQIPGDVLEIQGLYKYGRNPREDQKVPFELGDDPNVGATLLYTDTGLPWTQDWLNTSVPASIELVYTAQLTDPKRFPPLFTKALVWALAVKLAVEVRKDPDAAAKAKLEATAARAEARAAARREVRRDVPPIPAHIAARRGRRRG